MSSLSPDSQPTTSTSPLQPNEIITPHFEVASSETDMKHDDITPTANQQFTALKLEIVDSSEDANNVKEEEMKNLPDADPSLPPTISIGAKFDS